MPGPDKTTSVAPAAADSRTTMLSTFGTWERRSRFWALAITSLAAVAVALAGFVAIRAGWSPAGVLAVAVISLITVYRWRTRKIRRRRAILAEPFPKEWETVLQRDVVFFRALDAAEQQRFRRQLQVFIGEKSITGIKVQLDATTRVLAAASAIIPIFGFVGWEWDQINEVLVYPDRFDHEFQFDGEKGNNILGMVGTAGMNGLMILSKPDLISGFRNPTDKRNVGLHEFAHLVDKSDGVIDGIPSVGLSQQAIGPWIDLMRRKMAEIDDGNSDINQYALTNEAEFFAVTSEYFFERPLVLRRKHPELYSALERVFNRDFITRAEQWRRELVPVRKKFGRNSPCPCGSGLKFKKCCLE